MRCPLDRLEMTPIGSCVSKDERLIITSYLCSCGYRTIGRTPNPRYVPVPVFNERKENKGARTKRIARVDEGYTPKVCCGRCGETMREATVDNLCHSCAALEATAA